MLKLSVVIITLNEEKNIERCLQSVKDIADEIIVVDSYSDDRTEEICSEFGVKFIQQKFKGYVDQKNDGNALASHDYILSLDADEALSEELAASISQVKENWQFDAYAMNRLTSYCGKWIRHSGWYPDRKSRLFDRRKARWTGHLVHERVEVEGNAKTGVLKGDILHYSFYSIDEHINQSAYFADLSAQEMFEKGKNAGVFKLIINPCARFFRHYLLYGGFLDGYYGYVISKISARSTYWKYAKLRKMVGDKKKQN